MGLRAISLVLAVAVLAAAGLLAAAAPAGAARPPTPEPNGAVELSPRPCALEGRDPYERDYNAAEGWQAPDYERYPGACRRLRFSYGPIVVKPGQNDVLADPIKIEKPVQDGYITRFRPDLVRADGSVPPIEQVHLHHAAWVAVPEYGSGGSGAFEAAGEEKTILQMPKGFGLPTKATDAWLLIYMVHSAIQQPMEVYITYDVDFVPKADGDRLGLRDAYPLWWDVRSDYYPVFNVQRDFAGADGTCTWPREQCAAEDPFGKKIVGQGQPGNGRGADWRFPERGQPLGRIPSFTGGTIIAAGGHLHPGGLQNTIDLVRPGNTIRVRKGKGKRRRWVRKRKEVARIYTGEAHYWDRKDPSRGGGPPTSWDFSMKVSGLPKWGVRVEPGDIVRNNAVYDARIQSTYENMGIVVAAVVPDDPEGNPRAPGVDPFTTPLDTSPNCKSGGLKAKRGGKRLCDRGKVTHGHLAENDNFGAAGGAWSARSGAPASRVGIADFLYAPGDLSTIEMTGVPAVKLGSELAFTNFDGFQIPHTVTSCKFPCLGQTGGAFPISNGESSKGRQLDFDSGELGFGTPQIGPAKQTLDWTLPVTPEAGFEPGEIVTYFCRVHPGMRGAFEVQR